jgi:hypothetical protein
MARTSNIVFDILANDKNASATIDKVTGKFRDQERTLRALRVAGTAQFVALAAAAGVFASGSITAYAEAQEAQQGLNFVFSQFPKLADVNIDSLREYNSELAKKTVYDDDAIASGQAMLAQFDLTGKQVQELTPLLLDYAAKTGKDLPTAAQDLGKAVLGQGRALKAVGIDLQNTGDRTQNVTQLTEALAAKLGGFAENQAKTASGQVAILRNQYGELQEALGEELLPTLTDVLGVGLEVVSWANENQAAAAGLAVGVGTLSAGLAVAANWEAISTTAKTVHTAATWALTTAQTAGAELLGRTIPMKAADAAATRVSTAAIVNLTAATAANTAVSVQNVATSARATAGMSAFSKGSLVTAASVGIVSAELAYWNSLGKDLVDQVGGMTAKVDELDGKGVDNLLADLREMEAEIDGTNRGWEEGIWLVKQYNDKARDEGLIAAREAITDINEGLANQAINLTALRDETGMSYDALKRLAENEAIDMSDAYGSDTARIARERLVELAGGMSDTEQAQLGLSDATGEYIDLLEEQLDLQRQAAGLALDERSAARNYQEALDAVTAAIEKNGATLDISTEAGRANQATLDDMAKSTWDWVAAGAEANLTQFELDQRMTAGRQAFIDSAVSMGMSADKSAELATQMGLVPTAHNTTFTANTSQATHAVNALRATMDGLQFTMYNAARSNNTGVKRAGGGPIHGPGTSTSDSIPVWASDEEFMVQAAAHRKWGTPAMWAINNGDLSGFLGAIGARGFAGGGSVTGAAIASRPYVGLPANSVVSSPQILELTVVDKDGSLIARMRAEAQAQAEFGQRARENAWRR